MKAGWFEKIVPRSLPLLARMDNKLSEIC